MKQRNRTQIADDVSSPQQKMTRLRHFLWKAESMIDGASGVADIFYKYFKEPSVWNLAKSGLELSRKIYGLVLIDYYEHFTGWTTPLPEDYNYVMGTVLAKFPYVEKMTTDPDLSLRKIVFEDDEGDFELFYCINTQSNQLEGIHVRKEYEARARAVVRDAFRTQFGSDAVLMHKRKMLERGEAKEVLAFDRDNDVVPHETVRSLALAESVQRFVDAGMSRSILLFGPPGTGKSTCVRAVAKHLNMTTLRLRVEDLSDISNTAIFDALDIFQPDCVIIDDLDRVDRFEHLLEMTEHFNKHLKLIFATVNDTDELSEALLRPGRFDVIREVKEMDDETLRKILPSEIDPVVFSIVKDWPIAFTLEYLKRRRVSLSKEEEIDGLVELYVRVMSLKDYAGVLYKKKIVNTRPIRAKLEAALLGKKSALQDLELNESSDGELSASDFTSDELHDIEAIKDGMRDKHCSDSSRKILKKAMENIHAIAHARKSGADVGSLSDRFKKAKLKTRPRPGKLRQSYSDKTRMNRAKKMKSAIEDHAVDAAEDTSHSKKRKAKLT